MSTADILTELSANADGSLGVARSFPPAIYHDPGIFELEVERLFRRDWICIGREAEMASAGDYICRDLVETPVFAIRQRNGQIRAFTNVCLHRSARLLDGCGRIGRICCPYHAWTYEIDGQLTGAPFMQETPGFDTSRFRLRTVACETWEGFVYVSLADHPDPLRESLSGLSDLVRDFRMGNYVPVFEHEESWDANWKCLVENFMDAYHIHRVHKDSFARYGSSEDITHLYPGEAAYTYHVIQEDERRKSVFAHADNTWLRGDDRYKTYLINIFPSHVMQLQPDMLWYLSVLPDGANRLTIRWAVSIPAEILDAAGDRQKVIDDEMALIQQVNGEDRPIVENVFCATRSPLASSGPLSHLERNLWDFGRYLARRLCT